MSASAETTDVLGQGIEKVPAKKRTRTIALGLAAALAAVAGGTYYLTHRGIETTDDAQIDADVVTVPARTGATVTAIHFADNQAVEAGSLLFELDAAPASARLAAAEAELAFARASADAARVTAELAETNAKSGKDVAKASLVGATSAATASAEQIREAEANLVAAKAKRDKAKEDLESTHTLAAQGALSNSALTTAQTNFDTAEASVAEAEARVTSVRASTSQARARIGEAAARFGQADTVDAQTARARADAAAAAARVATAEAARDLAKLELSYTKVYAPHAGIASKRAVSVGQLLTPGQPLVMVVPTDRVWVTGNFKETQLARMHPGQEAHFTIDAYGGREVRGVVESVSGATGARFALLPPDNATGNFTKVVQRVPVRVKIVDPPVDELLLPGLSVELSVDTRR